MMPFSGGEYRNSINRQQGEGTMFKKPPGIEDIFPDRIDKWNFIINTAREVFRNHNYKEIIIPLLEYTEVFSRGIGDQTDIVSKEMFTFEDRGGRSLALRPEGTASVVRAYIEYGEYNRLSTCKLFYLGQMFRAERPQRGRLRQFNQFGAEFFGSDDPFYDYEIIAIMESISRMLGIRDHDIIINSIGCPQCRPDYIEALKGYYREKRDELCEDCKKRLERNPLRLLDCKVESCTILKGGAPRISSYLCNECRHHHTTVKEYLTMNSIDFDEDPYLVRGLDYYTRTTFEFITERLGGQNAFAAGGRYDDLVGTFGGKHTPAVGFAAGIERIFILLDHIRRDQPTLDAYLVHSGKEALQMAIGIINRLRLSNISADIDPVSKSLRAQLKRADRERARFAIIIGDEEVKQKSCTVKDMQTGEQNSIDAEHIAQHLLSKAHKNTVP
jgi:histidyl-tRNA synthetase